MLSNFMEKKSFNHKITVALSVLLLLFILRVMGQMLVVFLHVSFLPPMEEWLSGAIPYPTLLIIQIGIIILFGKICQDVFLDKGLFAKKNPMVGKFLMHFGIIYFSIMVVRYIVRMSLYPHEHWVGGCIPIFFHLVLATFIFLYGYYNHYTNKHVAHTRKVTLLISLLYFVGVVGITLWAAQLIAPYYLSKYLNIDYPEYAIRIDKNVSIEMSDGTKLNAEIFHPTRLSKSPTILVRIPLTPTLKNKIYMGIIGRMWAGHGYTVIIQGVRGYFGSEGEYEPFINERPDGIKTLEWIRNQTWYDGHIGMWGGSYFGYTQFAIADQLDPDTSSLMVQIATPNIFKFFYPQNNAYSFEGSLYWALRSYSGEDTIPDSDILNKAYSELPTIDADNRVDKQITFFDDWTKNTTSTDPYWESVDTEEYVRNNKIPILFMAGWSDPFLPFQLEDYNISRHNNSESRLIIGPWKHAETLTLPGNIIPNNYRLESLRYSIPWFDKTLKSKNDDLNLPPVRIFVIGENKWRNESEWPLARTRYTSFYLNQENVDRTLTLSSGKDSQVNYRYDPQNPVWSNGGASLGPSAGIKLQDQMNRSDIISYHTSILDNDMEITGPIKSVLYVSTDALNTDFTVKLIDVFPDGSSYNISNGIIRQNFIPKNPTKIKIDLWPTSILIPKGHYLQLEISSSNYPRFDRNPNTGAFIPTATTTQIANQTIYSGEIYPSQLILPVIPR